MSEDIERSSEEALGEAATFDFLRKHGVRSVESFEPHQPLLYVFEEQHRGPEGPLRKYPVERRPSFARIDDPVLIDFGAPRPDDAQTGRIIYDLKNEGGRVDFFAITKGGTIVRVDDEARHKHYQVRKEALFIAPQGFLPQERRE